MQNVFKSDRNFLNIVIGRNENEKRIVFLAKMEYIIRIRKEGGEGIDLQCEYFGV